MSLARVCFCFVSFADMYDTRDKLRERSRVFSVRYVGGRLSGWLLRRRSELSRRQNGRFRVFAFSCWFVLLIIARAHLGDWRLTADTREKASVMRELSGGGPY